MDKAGKFRRLDDESRSGGVPRMLISVDEFCESTHVGKTTFYGLVKRGDIRVLKVGRRTLIEFSEIAAFLARLRQAGTA